MEPKIPYPTDLTGIVKSGYTMASPDQSPDFFTSPGTQIVMNNLLVKRYSNGSDDNIYIIRLNKGPNGSRFRFPALFISSFIKKMNDLLKKLEPGENNAWTLPGMETISTWKDMSSDPFWEHESSLRIMNFRVRPYFATFGTIMFRMWNEVEEAHQKTYESDRGQVMWRGPATSITVEMMRRLVSAMEKLSSMAPELQ